MDKYVYLVVLLGIAKVYADTPANCTYEDVRGSWVFQIGSKDNDKTLNCSTFSKAQSQLKVDLLFPDVAVDEFGNTGFWTLIYNQGFEVVIGGRKYFAFSKFTKQGKNVTSICDQTSPGWSHTLEVREWACFVGQKMKSLPPKVYQEPESKDLSNIYFKQSQEYIDQINNAQSSWTAGVYEQFEGLTMEDMVKMAGGRKSRIPHKPRATFPTAEQLAMVEELPAAFDWRKVNGQNFVSPVRDQKQCGSCYAFGSLAMDEARIRIMTNNSNQVILSTQDIVECSEYSQGCEGGFPYLIAGKYAEDFGLVAESCNPYKGEDGPCRTDKTCARQYATKYEYVGGYYGACNEALMRMELVKNGPLAVAFEVYSDFFSYKGGVYVHSGIKNKFNPFELTNHAVLAVGYGYDEASKLPYWIVKNSWGEKWGLSGYFKILRGADECAIESISVRSTPTF